jgi:hypothetical protein
MKLKLVALAAALSFATAPAWAMDCCKDGKCACCDKMREKDGDKPADPQSKPKM